MPVIKGETEIEEVRVKGVGVVWTGVEVIDNFEDGSAANWHVPSSTGGDQIISPGLAGTDFRWQLNGFREGSLDGVDAIDRGPQQGDKFEYRFRIDEYSPDSALFRFAFASSSVSDDAQYRVEYELNDPDPDVAIYKGNSGETSTFKPIDPVEGDVVRAVVRWNYGDNDIEIDHYVGGSFLHTISITDTEYTQPGVSVFVGANCIISLDEVQILDSV